MYLSVLPWSDLISQDSTPKPPILCPHWCNPAPFFFERCERDRNVTCWVFILVVCGFCLCRLGKKDQREKGQCKLCFSLLKQQIRRGWVLLWFSRNLILAFFSFFHVCVCIKFWGMYLRKIFAHLKDNELLRWVASCDFIYIDFLENEVLSCVFWACWKGVQQLEVLPARNCNVYSLGAGLAGGSVAAREVWREYEGNVWKESLQNISLFCASDRGLRDFFNVLFPPAERIA